MAEVYRKVRGKPIQKYLANTREVQKALTAKQKKIARTAEYLLLIHRNEGSAYISTSRGRVDRYIVLNDPDGGAMAIEFGRQPNENGNGGMEGLWILHKAAGLRRD